MSEMEELVARALNAQGSVALDWKGWVPYARAAIAAMREPTETMIDAGKGVMWLDDMAAEVWRAMIDAALAGTETGD